MKWFFEKEEKKNPVGSSLIVRSPIYAGEKKDKSALAEEGYKQNVIVYRAIREITTGLANIELEVHKDGEYLDEPNHPALALLNQPNPMQGFDSFIKNIFTDYLITGEMFITRYPLNSSKPPSELWALNPMKMTVKCDKDVVPSAYIYEYKTENEKVFPVSGISAKSDVFFLKMYNPTDYWRGFAPLEAAALAGDTHNAGLKWNYSLLRNGAAPSGIVSFEDVPSDDVLSRLKEFFKKTLQGSNNAGEVPILTGGAKWTEMSKSPRDMDFLNTMKEASKYVASAFGVPLPLIDNDASSFNNIEQAKERLWTDTIIPMLNEFLGAFSVWYLPAFGEGLELKANLDSVAALEAVRERRYNRMINGVKAGVLTINEARDAIGYDAIDGLANELMIGSGQVPVSMSGFDMTAMSEDEKAFAFDMKNLGFDDLTIKQVMRGRE